MLKKMPRRLLALLLLLTAICLSQQTAQIHALTDITGTGAIVALSATSLQARWVSVYAPTGNSGTAYCCDTSAGAGAVSSSKGQPIAANQSYFFPAAGPNYDLSTIYILIANGDKIKVTYQF